MKESKLVTKSLEHLANRSFDRVNKQSDALSSLHSKTSTIFSVATIALTLLLTLSDFGHLRPWMKAIIIVGSLALIFVFYLLFKIIKTVDLKLGLSMGKYDNSSQKEYQDVLLEEIGANRTQPTRKMKLLSKDNI